MEVEQPPKEPVCLRMTSLFFHSSNDSQKDKKIQKHITEHCSRCPSFCENHIQLPQSQCEDQLCTYIHWFYRHYWLNHKRSQNIGPCSTCEHCSRLHQWMTVHSADCLKSKSKCSISICCEMKKSLHLSRLGEVDHNFIRQLEGQALLTHSAPNSLFIHRSSSTHSLPVGTPPYHNHCQHPNAHTQQNGHPSVSPASVNSPVYPNHTPYLEGQSLPHNNFSSAHTGMYNSQRQQRYRPSVIPELQVRGQQSTSQSHPVHHNGNNFHSSANDFHSNSNTQMGSERHHHHANVPQQNGFSERMQNVNRPYSNFPEPGTSYHQNQSHACSNGPHSVPVTPEYNGENHHHHHMGTQIRMSVEGIQRHGPTGCVSVHTDAHQLTTTPSEDLKLSRQYSSASSGYVTASSTGRQSVTSIFSRDHSMTDLYPENNTLQVQIKPQRKISAPVGINNATRSGNNAKKMPHQHSQSLTSFEHIIPESPGSPPPQSPTCTNTNILLCDHSDQIEGCSMDADSERQPPSLQRQDTDHETKVVFSGGLESSLNGSSYQALLEKGKIKNRQRAVDDTASSSSPPVTKRPLQREDSDVHGKSKIVLSGERNRPGSNSLTRDEYDSIFKFQEQRGILSDVQTREKVLSKQRKQVAAKDRRLRQGTTSSDVQSDFDTESSTSDIPGSSPLTSGEFSELDQDLTDQDEEKKINETEATVAELIGQGMSTEEQVQMIQRIKASKLQLTSHVNLVKIPEHLLSLSPAMTTRLNRSKSTNYHTSPATSEGISLPPEISSPAYAPSQHPLHSLTPGMLASNTSSSSISDGMSTIENERFSNNTLKEEEENFPSYQFSPGDGCGPATLSSTDGSSTLTGGSLEGRFNSMRLPSGPSSVRNQDITEAMMMNSPVKGSMPALPPQSLNFSQHPHSGVYRKEGGQRETIPSSPMDTDADRTSYEYSKSRSMESGAHTSPSHVPVPFFPGKFKLASSHVEEMCKTVDNVKEKYHDDLVRMKYKGQLAKQEIPDLPEEEQQRNIPGPGRWACVNEHGDGMLYNGPWSSQCPESAFPEMERRYYNEMLRQQFPDSQEEVTRDVERRHQLKKHLLGKFHSNKAYREGVHWQRKTELGKGGQAMCYSIQDIHTHLIMALKEEKEDVKTLDEAYACMKLSSLSNASQNIVDYYCAAMLPKEYCLRRISLVQIFMEMMPASLYSFLNKNGPFGVDDLHHFGYQLFDALDYLHNTVKIIHCDVKPSNLLLDYTAQRLKLTDFGFSQILNECNNEVRGDENAGTLAYNPPEHYRERRCTFALDIWQAGCTLLTMATTRRPWRHLFMDVVKKNQPLQFVHAVRKGQAKLIGEQTGGHIYPSFLDDSLKKLLHGCLHPDHQSRLSAQDCVYLLLMAGVPQMNEEHREKINQTIGYWRTPPAVLSTFKQDVHYVDVYLETTVTRKVDIDGTRYSLSPGWLGCVPFHDGMTFEQLEKEVLPQNLPVMKLLPSVRLMTSENSPQSIFMKTIVHPNDLNFEPAPPQSLIDRTKAVIISSV